MKPHILILGAGFGGMYVARELKSLVKKGEVDVTIVNETNYFLFTPLLHEVATGALAPQSVAEPLREIFAGTDIKICQGTVTSIDREHRMVTVLGDVNGDDIHHRIKHEIAYDFLVIATGATTNYYNIPGADIHTYPLKTLADAAEIRRRVIDSFEEAILCDDPIVRARLLSFVVVGGGPTGIEIVSELAELIKGMVKRYYYDTKCNPNEAGSCGPEEPTITLIHAGPELLQQFSPTLREAAADKLTKAGVKLQLSATVINVTPRGLELANNTTVSASTVIWAAGVKPIIPPFVGDMPALIGGRLVVDEYFRLNGDERVFALGDVAGYIDMMHTTAEKPMTLPMLAQVAVGQSRLVAKNICVFTKGKKMKKFEYHSKGSMVSVGQWFAIGEIFSMKIAGRLTWWLWRTVYLFKFISWKKRLRIVIDWTLDAFYPRDITKL
ncbi:MAG TPA: NAD(P)/FAD-dependent oxidoreductase [Candidatus Paceibacterota bacterium]|jgi:NADH dehydrogenase|nr:NAD(P)/FAD-dependent oxidoreductase [Candidatus Paceibacterota bacterium]